MKELKDFRKQYGYSREQMAQALNISISLYNKIEFGQRPPSQNFMTKFKAKFPSFDMNIFFVSSEHETCN